MTRQDNTSDTGEAVMRPASLQLDPAKYRAEIDLFEITEAQKQELLLTLWAIMSGLVELGFNVDVSAILLNDLTPNASDDTVQ